MSSSVLLRLSRRAKLIQAQTLREESSHQSPLHTPLLLLPFLILSLSVSLVVSCFFTHYCSLYINLQGSHLANAFMECEAIRLCSGTQQCLPWDLSNYFLFSSLYLVFSSTCKIPRSPGLLCAYTKAQTQQKYHAELNHL